MPVSSSKEDLVKRRNVNLKISVGGKDSGKGKLESTTVIGHGNFEQGKVGEFEKLMLVSSMQGKHE